MLTAIAALGGTNASNLLTVGYTGTDAVVLGAGYFTRLGNVNVHKLVSEGR